MKIAICKYVNIHLYFRKLKNKHLLLPILNKTIIPRSTITDSVYACKRLYTFLYTTVKDRILAFYMGPYYAQYIVVTYTEKYDHIRRNTEQNGDRIGTPYRATVNDRACLTWVQIIKDHFPQLAKLSASSSSSTVSSSSTTSSSSTVSSSSTTSSSSTASSDSLSTPTNLSKARKK